MRKHTAECLGAVVMGAMTSVTSAFRLVLWLIGLCPQDLSASYDSLNPRGMTESTCWDPSGPQFPHLKSGGNNSTPSGVLRIQ